MQTKTFTKIVLTVAALLMSASGFAADHNEIHINSEKDLTPATTKQLKAFGLTGAAQLDALKYFLRAGLTFEFSPASKTERCEIEGHTAHAKEGSFEIEVKTDKCADAWNGVYTPADLHQSQCADKAVTPKIDCSVPVPK